MQVLRAWGLDTILLEMETPSYARESLLAIQQGRVLSLVEANSAFAGIVKTVPYFTVGQVDLNPTCPISMSPPPDRLARYNFRLGPLVDPLITGLSGALSTMPRVAMYPGILNLPRSADSKTFLETVPLGSGKRKGTVYAMGSSGHQAPPGCKVVEPGDHFSQFLKYETVVCHGGAGTVQTAAAAGCRVIAIDNVLDRDYVNNLDAGSGVSGGANPDKVILLLLARDFGPLFFSLRGGFRLALTAYGWYFRMYATSDFLTLLTLWLSLPSGPIVVPGSLPLTIIATTTSVAFGSLAGALAIFITTVWGAMLFARIGLSPHSIMMNIFRTGRKITGNTVASALLSARYYRSAVAVLFFYEYFLPFAALLREAFKNPQSYVDVYWIERSAGVPFHTALRCAKTGKTWEGVDNLSGLSPVYRLQLVDPIGKTPAFSIPTSINVENLKVKYHGQAGYSFLTNNCQTVIMSALDGHIFLLGPALLFILPMCLVAIVLGVVGTATILFTAFALFMIGVFLPEVAVSPWSILRLMNDRFRAVAALDRLSPSDSLIARALRTGLVLTAIAGLSPRDENIVTGLSELYRELRAFPADLPKVDVAANVQQLFVRYPFLREAIPGVDALLAFFNIQFNMATDFSSHLLDLTEADTLLLAAHDQSSQLLAQLSDTYADPIEFADMKHFSEFLSAHAAPLVRFDDDETSSQVSEDELDLYDQAMLNNDVICDVPVEHHKQPFLPLVVLCQSLQKAPDCRFQRYLLDSTPSVDIVAEVLSHLYSQYPIAGQGPPIEVLRKFLAESDVDDIFTLAIAKYLFYDQAAFKTHEQELSQSLDTTTLLSEDMVNTLAVLTAVSLKFGADDVQAVTEAVLNCKDLLHGDSAPLMSAEDNANSDINSLYEWSKPVRTALQWFADTSFKARKWLRQSTWWNQVTLPIDALFSFIGVVIYSLVYGLIRVFGFLFTTMGELLQMPVESLEWVIAKFTMLMQMVDPRHRVSPKPVWALLWKRKRANISPAEAMLFSMADASYVQPPTYAAWVDTMAELLDTGSVDTSVLTRVPPSRMVFYPNNPVGLVPEHQALDLAVQAHFTETAEARRVFEDSIRAGNKLAIDGAWLATPEAVQASIERYTIPRPAVDIDAQYALTAAAKALFKHYSAIYERPLPMTVSAVAHLSKWKYAAGLPFMPAIKKRETLRHSAWFQAIQQAATKILTSGKMPAVGLHAFPKNQILEVQKILDNPLKLRTVTAGDRVTAVAVNTLLMERNKRIAPVSYGLLNMMRRTEGSINQLGPYLKAFPWYYSGDGAAFDSSVATEVATVGSVKLFELGFKQFGVYNTKAAVSVVKAYYEALTHGLVVNLNSGQMIWKTGGGGTGSAATTPDNRDWTRLVFTAAWSLLENKDPSDFFKHFFFTNASDDVFFSCSDHARDRLPDLLAQMQQSFGVNFAVKQQTTLNDILHLVQVPEEEVDKQAYLALGVSLPETHLRHDPQRLLFTRSAFRADRARANQMVMAQHIAERSCGYQLLCAHNKHEYDMITRDLVDANLTLAKGYFRNAEAILKLDDAGFVIDGLVDLPDNEPGRQLNLAVKKFKRRNPQGDVPAYIARVQRQVLSGLRQRRGKSYNEIFRLWVTPAPDPNTGKAAKRWRVYSKAATFIGPVSDMVRLGVLRMDDLWRQVPKALTNATPEKASIGTNRPFNTWDFTLEQFIFRKEFLRTKMVPTFARMSALARESPFSSAMDISAFYALLAQPSFMANLLSVTMGETKAVRGSTWLVSNDAIMGRVIAYLGAYTFIDKMIAIAESRAIFGVFVILIFATFRWLEVFYSVQGLAYWTATGTASIVISNSMPRDRYAIQKVLSTILASMVPWFITDYFHGLWDLISHLGPFIELQTLLPFLLNSANTTIVSELVREPDDTWGPFLNSPFVTQEVIPLSGGTGTGKSTALPFGIIKSNISQVVVVSVPTNRLVTGYVNDFIPDAQTLLVSSETQRTEVFNDYSIIVMTHAQTWRRKHQIPKGALILLDEVHDVSTDLLLAFSAAREGRFKVVAATATPSGIFWSKFLIHYEPFHQPSKRRFGRAETKVVSSFELAVNHLRNIEVNLDQTMFYSPIVRTLEMWSTLPLSAGTLVSFATRTQTPLPIKSAVFATGVVLAGANIRPSPLALVYEPYKMVAVNTASTKAGAFYVVQAHELDSITKLEKVPLSLEEIHQLEGRVGREQFGHAIRIGHVEPGHLTPNFSFGLLSQLSPTMLEVLRPSLDLPDHFQFIDGNTGFSNFNFAKGLKAENRYKAFVALSLLTTFSTPAELMTAFSMAFKTPEYEEVMSTIIKSAVLKGFTGDRIHSFYDCVSCFVDGVVFLYNGKAHPGVLPIIVQNKLVLYSILGSRASYDFFASNSAFSGLDTKSLFGRVIHDPLIVLRVMNQVGGPETVAQCSEKWLRLFSCQAVEPFVIEMSCCISPSTSQYETLVIGYNPAYLAVKWYSGLSGGVSLISRRHNPDQPAPISHDMVCGRPSHLSWPDHFHCHSPPQQAFDTSFILPAGKIVKPFGDLLFKNIRHQHHYRPRFAGRYPPYTPEYF
jgi:hypothetical protein